MDMISLDTDEVYERDITNEIDLRTDDHPDQRDKAIDEITTQVSERINNTNKECVDKAEEAAVVVIEETSNDASAKRTPKKGSSRGKRRAVASASNDGLYKNRLRSYKKKPPSLTPETGEIVVEDLAEGKERTPERQPTQATTPLLYPPTLTPQRPKKVPVTSGSDTDDAVASSSVSSTRASLVGQVTPKRRFVGSAPVLSNDEDSNSSSSAPEEATDETELEIARKRLLEEVEAFHRRIKVTAICNCFLCNRRRVGGVLFPK